MDGRSDLYSLGVTLYEMLTGRKPFVADTSYSVLNAQLNQPPTPPLELNPAHSAGIEQHRAARDGQASRGPVPDGGRISYRAAGSGRGADGGHSECCRTHGPDAGGGGAERTLFRAAACVLRGSSLRIGRTAPAPPPFTPVVQPTPPPVATAGPRRGLWIGLGAATALLALIAVASLLPRMLSTHASQKPAAVATDTPAASTPASSPQPSRGKPNRPSPRSRRPPSHPLTPSTPASTPQPPRGQRGHIGLSCFVSRAGRDCSQTAPGVRSPGDEHPGRRAFIRTPAAARRAVGPLAA